MAKNNFPYSAPGLYSDAYNVTPDDATDLDPVPQALWVGTTGDLTVTMPSGDVTLLAVPSGTLIPLRAVRVLETTTATDIVALV